jgi:uncharacterized membrane protein
MRNEESAGPAGLNAFSDGVFAVIITILVLEPPQQWSGSNIQSVAWR